MDATTDAVFQRATASVAIVCRSVGRGAECCHAAMGSSCQLACSSLDRMHIMPSHPQGNRRRESDAGVVFIQEGTAPNSHSDHRRDVERTRTPLAPLPMHGWLLLTDPSSAQSRIARCTPPDRWAIPHLLRSGRLGRMQNTLWTCMEFQTQRPSSSHCSSDRA